MPAHSSKRRSPIRKVMLHKWRHKKRKHRIFSHFHKDRNCDTCLRNKITRVPCRRRDEGSIPRAEQFGDLITADHKVLNEGRESWHNHRYAVVVQDLATQWINLNRVKTKFAGDGEESTKVSRAVPEVKVIETENSLEFGESCEKLSWTP